MIRRLQITLLALFVSVWAMASETSVKNADGVEIWYDFDSNAKTASVTYRGEYYYSYVDEYIGNVVIPSKVTYEGEEYSVTEIEWNVFRICSSLTSITISEGVTSIGYYAFEDCSSLTSITLPGSVKTIGEGAFSGCSSLTSIDVALDNNSYTSIDGVLFSKDKTILIKYPGGKKDATSYIIPESVTEIGEYAFDGCSSLTSITIPESVTEIGEYAFYDCSSLTSITLPESVTSIGNDAFYGCSSLTSITIPEGVTSIGDYAFKDCYKLYEVYNKSNLAITAGSSENGYVAYYAKNVYTDESEESKLKTVGDYIFYVDEDNIELLVYLGDETAITLLSDYEGKNYKIGDYAFDGCSTLTSITIPEGVTSIGGRAFRNCSSLTSITIPESVTEIGESAFYVCSSLTSITIPKGVTEIGDDVFCGCSSLTSITIPEGVTSIGGYAFYGCSGLTSVTIPEGVTSIGNYAFSYCSGLTCVEFNAKNCTTMGNYSKPVFSGCTKLTNLTIGENVTNIPSYAFYGCSGLTSVEFNAKNCTSMGSYDYPVFSGCTKLTNLTIGENVTNIPSYAFYGCSGLTSVEFNANNCTSMGNYSEPVFSGCTKLTNLTIGENVTNIPSYAFKDCSGLTSVTIPESVAWIGNEAFYGCSGLTSVTIPDGVTWIGDATFYGCSGLTSVMIPEGVTWIGWSAFYNCSGFTSITSKNATPPYIGDSNSFYEVDKSIPVYVLKQSVEAYKSTEYWKDFTNIVGKFLVVTATAENGTVTGAGVYEENEEVTLIATPDEGYTFVKWSDGETNVTRKITVTEDVTLTAVFESNSSDSPITDVVADSVSIRLIGNSLIVEGAESYAVYALSGQNLGKVESLERGVYIVVADGVSKRIVVK